MQFKQFLDLMEEIDQLLAEAGDSIEWSPETVKGYNPHGITSDHQTHIRDRQVDADSNRDGYGAQFGTAQTTEPKQGDVVMVQDQAGNHTSGVIVSINNGNVQIVNNNKKMNVTRPASGLGLAPPMLAQKLNLGGKGNRNVWMYRA